MNNHPQIASLYQIYQSESQPFRKVHRMIDLFESILKTHTAVIMGEYFSRAEISNEVKGLLSDGLRTPSLGTWQLFSRVLLKELKEKNHQFLLAPFAQEFDWLDTTMTKKHDVIAFRNGYAHGATPSDEQCVADMLKFEPFLQQLLQLSWLQDSSITVVDGQALLKDNASAQSLSLYPIVCVKQEEDHSPFVFFNDLKSNKVGLLNYTLSKHYRDKDFYDAFHQVLPLQEWKKSGSHEFKQRIEELTETFKGRTLERATIQAFVVKSDKGYLSIQGNPGIGKSALIAQVFKDLSQEELKSTIQLTEYFIRRGTQQAQPTFLLEYLIKKTDALFAQGKSIRAEGKTNYEIQQALFEKWRLYGEQNTVPKLVFLIDGLDEGVENGIMNYLPRENFKNILLIYGSRPGGHKDIENFWGQLPVEQHTKIELQGLSRQDIRALLYEVANKYELQEDWIGVLEERSQGNPLYLKLLCNALEEGSIHINDAKALPKEINEYYKAILLRYAALPDGDALLNSLFVFAAAIDYLTPAHLAEILTFGPATQTNVMSTLVEVLYENPLTDTVLDYQLFHESLREFLKQDRSSEIAKAEQKIIAFCSHWQGLADTYEQRYALDHYATHLAAQQLEQHHKTLISLTKNSDYTAAQKKVLRKFDPSFRLYQYGIETAVKNNWNEEAIDCGLAIVDLKYEEQNDVPAILEMVKNNEMELALKRITDLGGVDKEDKKRQFIVIMLCLMELTLLESKTQPWRKASIEKLLVIIEEQIPIDYSVLKWNDFFPSYLMFLIAVELKAIEVDHIGIYKRTNSWDTDWIKYKGQYSVGQLDVLIQTAEGINDDFDKSTAFREIAVSLGYQGKLKESSKLLEQSIRSAEGIDDGLQKSTAFKEIAVVLGNQGNLEESSQLLAQSILTAKGIKYDWEKSSALKEIAVVLANLGKLEESSKLLEQSIQTAEGIDDGFVKSSAFKEIAVMLVNQGDIEQSIQTAEGIKDDWQKSLAFTEIAFVLANQGKMEESSKLLEQSITTAQRINDDYKKSIAFKEIAVVLANQGEIEQSIQESERINDGSVKRSAFREIAVVLAKHGEIEQSIQTAQRLNDDDDNKSSNFTEYGIVLANQGELWKLLDTPEGMKKLVKKKSSVFTEIAVVSAIQGKLKETSKLLAKSIQKAQGIKDGLKKNCTFRDIAVVLANKREIEKSIQTAEGINDDYQKSTTFTKVAFELSNQGKLDKSSELLQQSIQMAERIYNSWQKNYAIKDIALVLAYCGEMEQSIQTAERINDDDEKSSAFTKIALVLANRGEIEQSIKTAEGIDDDLQKSVAFKEIAVVLANRGEIEQSIKTAEGIDDDLQKSVAFKEIAVVLANRGEIEQTIKMAECINDDWQKILAFTKIAVVFSNQGKLEESSKLLEQSIQTAEGIYDDDEKNSAFGEIALVLANRGEIDQSIEAAERINDEDEKSSAFGEIAVVLANRGEIEQSIRTVEGMNVGLLQSHAFTDIAVILASQGKLSESVILLQKISRGNDRMEALVTLGKNFYENNQFQNQHQTLTQLPNNEAVTFFKKGIAQSITAITATEATILQLLLLLKEDKESTEHLLQMHALYCTFFEKNSKEKIAKFNRTLNIQWALDIAAKFEQDEKKTADNIETWIEAIADEDDREDVLSWAEKVKAGTMTEEKFEERITKLMG